MKAVIVILANLTLLLLPSLYSIAPDTLPVSPASIIGILQDHNNRNGNTDAGGVVYAAEEGPIQYTPAEIDNLMKLGTKGIMEKAYKEGTVIEIVDFSEVYKNKSYVFYYDSGYEQDVQKRLAVITYGLSKDPRLKNIRIYGCDISERPGFKRADKGVYADSEVSGHGTIAYPTGAIFDKNNKPTDMFDIGPIDDIGTNNFLKAIPDWVYSNLIAPLTDEKGEYFLRFTNQGKPLERVY